MKKAFLVNITILLAANLVIKPLYVFGIDRTVQNLVGSEAYGVYITLFNLTMLFQIVSDFGVRYLNNREIAQHQQLFLKYFSHLVVFKGLLAVLFTVVCYLAAWVLGYEAYYYQLLSIMIVSQLLTDFILYLRSNVSGLQYYLQDSLLSIADKLLMIVFVGTLIVFNPLGQPFQIEWLVYAQILASMLTAALSLWVIRKHLRGVRLRFSWPFLVLILRRTWAYALAVFLMSVYLRSDVIIMERILADGARQSGIYYQAYRLITAANMIGVLFSGLLLPMFARLLKAREGIGELLAFSFQVLFAMLMIACVNVVFFREPIMVALYDEGTAYSGDILGWLMVSFVATGGTYIFGSLLTANENLRALNWLYGVAMVFNVTANLLFIPRYAALGAAIVTAATQFLVLGGQIWLSVCTFELRPQYPLLGRLLAFSAGVMLVGWGVPLLLDATWIVSFLVALLASTALAFLFKVIDLRGLIALLRDR